MQCEECLPEKEKSPIIHWFGAHPFYLLSETLDGNAVPMYYYYRFADKCEYRYQLFYGKDCERIGDVILDE